MPGSHALELHEKGDQGALAKHMDQLTAAARKRGEERQPEKEKPWYMEPCCANEKRSMQGGCLNCGDPCL